jgi:hypothetical protein
VTVFNALPGQLKSLTNVPCRQAEGIIVATRTTDQDVATAKQTMVTQESSMDDSATRVRALRDEIPSGFSAPAVTTYQERLDDWRSAYEAIKASFNDAMNGFTSAHGGIDQGHGHANSVAGNSFGVYNGLR